MHTQLIRDGITYEFSPSEVAPGNTHLSLSTSPIHGFSIPEIHAQRVYYALSDGQVPLQSEHHRKFYSSSQVDAALCVWEYVLNNIEKDVFKPLLEGHGFGCVRSCSVQAGVIIDALYNYVEDQGYEYASAFDWEFVPDACSLLDWEALMSDNQYGRGRYDPDIPTLFERFKQIAGERDLITPEQRKAEYLKSVNWTADRQWSYPTLGDEHPDYFERAFAEGQSAHDAVKAFGEKYDFTPRSTR